MARATPGTRDNTQVDLVPVKLTFATPGSRQYEELVQQRLAAVQDELANLRTVHPGGFERRLRIPADRL